MKYTTASESELQNLLNESRSEISGYEFEKIDLTEYELKSAVFIDCKFIGCHLANCSLLNVSLRGVVFEDCNLMGINWTEVRKNGSFSFKGCKLDYSSFQAVDLRGVSFENCVIREADFSGANLSKSSFSQANLSGTSFANANLEKADLRGARSYFIHPKFTKIKDAHFSFPEALVLIEAMGAKIEI
ncbi:pentapeptide repeat-containing protein [Bdellovibrio sp. HCB274]|uniref:pentapeptide repeat-containing protein n=1 Tax=Bdellovibrio sp. HCB274 TaxID=3394361 RepID=UPI0039B5CBFE